MKATVISDASFYQQGRRGRSYAGWAAWVRVDGLDKALKGYGIIKPECLNSTEAEVYAALNGIWIAARAGATDVLVRSDCMAVTQLIRGMTRSERLISIWRRAIHEASLGHVNLGAAHVKGHGPIDSKAAWVNDWCDSHARIAMREARRGKQCLAILSN